MMHPCGQRIVRTAEEWERLFAEFLEEALRWDGPPKYLYRVTDGRWFIR